ncbi:homoserine dehydrogenase [Leptospirillum ferriphilum]|uniref:Homoserine dehydrogenase n=1 Tax=Leptospirillum ferriphilum TaxID=178606 RepID=A0A1V3SVD5_9BACT|nr:homoserine dehydrogenase [Leptospirillum ferriphilum]OOH72789.1 homoserine dehydrogenase [Leptospirillum ferriphilum]
MKPVRVMIIGLGRVGSRFYEKFRALGDDRVKILAVSEINLQHPYLSKVVQDGVPAFRNYRDALSHWGTEIDIVLDTTNIPAVKNDLRHFLEESGNHHTVLLPLVVSYLLWHMTGSNDELVQDHIDPGY